MRKQMVAGNWKMNMNFQQAEELITAIVDELNERPVETEIVVCPPFPYLEMIGDHIEDSEVLLGAQNVSAYEKGAYTGEVAAFILDSLDVSYAIVGHSERRKYFNESNEVLLNKVKQLLNHGLYPIFCCGELLEERKAASHFDIVKQQLEQTIFKLSLDEFSQITIAYEPVWAIGTGETATPEQAQEMHAFIRRMIRENYDTNTAEETTILYGGSCNASNAASLFSKPDVDGGLIGGASLNATDFVTIANSF